MAYTNDTEQLAEVRAAISQVLTAQKWKHGDDEAEHAKLADLRDLEKELEAKVNTTRRGPQVRGFKIMHGGR